MGLPARKVDFQPNVAEPRTERAFSKAHQVFHLRVLAAVGMALVGYQGSEGLQVGLFLAGTFVTLAQLAILFLNLRLETLRRLSLVIGVIVVGQMAFNSVVLKPFAVFSGMLTLI